MGDPVDLPKFELPGEKPHWAIRAAWISGIVLIAAVVGLGAVIMHHRRLELDAHVAREEAIARVKAEAEAKVAAAAAVARAQREAELAAQRAAVEKAAAEKAAAKAAALAAAGQAADAGEAGAKGAKGAAAHRSHSGHGGKAAKPVGSKVAMKSADSESGAQIKDKSTGGKPSNGKPDPIDEMLKKMK